MQALVSVMIPYYNDEKFLSQSIDSVLNQTYTNLELILINHACTDKSREIARSYTDSRIRHIDLERNMGAGGSLIFFEFFRQAKGEYVKMFCADDLLVENAIELLVAHMQAIPEIDLLGGAMKYIDENSKPTSHHGQEGYTYTPANDKDVIQRLVERNTPFAYPTVMLKREVALKAYVNPILVYLADVQLWTSLAMQGYTLRNFDKLICLYRIHGEQTSAIGGYNRVHTATEFEMPLFSEVIFTTKESKIVKIICEESPFVDLIDKVEKSLFPFILHHYFLHFGKNLYMRSASFTWLAKFLATEENRKRVDETFSYTIKDLRSFYRDKKLLDLLEKAPVIVIEKKPLTFRGFIKRCNPFYHWAGAKAFRNNLRALVGIKRKDRKDD